MGQGDSPAVFANRFDRSLALARHSLSQALLKIRASAGLEAFTPHDLRRTAATLAQQEGIGFEAVSALLNHTNPSITAVYARHDFGREKREAVEAIERAILRIAEP